MIADDDPRHGTRAGYIAGCKCRPCRDATARYERGREWDELRGAPRTVPVIGAQRRIQALQALGWSSEELSARLGFSRAWVAMTVRAKRSGKIYRRNHDLIVALYDELSMTFPPETHCTGRQRELARRKGYAPPLAWDEATIDDPEARPATGASKRHRSRDEVDEVIVLRLLAGIQVEHSTKAERDEAMRRWLSWGRPERALLDIHGWKDGRYGRDAA